MRTLGAEVVRGRWGKSMVGGAVGRRRFRPLTLLYLSAVPHSASPRVRESGCARARSPGCHLVLSARTADLLTMAKHPAGVDTWLFLHRLGNRFSTQGGYVD